jgi:hypothetical protein
MADRFGIPQVVEYLDQMGIKVARVDHEQEILELAFYGDQGQWRMIVGFQQEDEARKMMFLIPHIGTITEKRRRECLEALMAVNYRIALGKFGLDPEDGEIRLEEVLPIANHHISFEQFQLAIGSVLQVAVIYQSLISRIVFGELSPEEALRACEQEFIEDETIQFQNESGALESEAEEKTPGSEPELDLNDVMEEVHRLLEERKD